MVSSEKPFRATRSASLELICDSALLVSRKCLNALNRLLFDYLELSEVVSSVRTNGIAR